MWGGSMDSNNKYYNLVCKLPIEYEHKLNSIIQVYGVSRAGFIKSVINSEFDKINGNEQVRQLLEQMKELGKSFEDLTGFKIDR